MAYISFMIEVPSDGKVEKLIVNIEVTNGKTVVVGAAISGIVPARPIIRATNGFENVTFSGDNLELKL